ncbi:MAG: SDR family oxidoreductase [Acidimicrobiia bacterium]|nr:SDR family oxidoreductase [Acidimicrobiia bacterium]
MDLHLDGRRALVAAASDGLGYAIAAALAVEGCRLAICSRDRDRIDAAAARIRESTGAEVHASVCEMAEPGGASGWVAEAAAGLGGIDLLVANAGGPPPGRIDAVGPEQWDAAYRLTLRSALETSQAARPHLARGASVLFMTSTSAKQPLGVLSMSTVFRAGVAALAKLLSDEWAADGIRVNHLIPGRIATSRLISLDEDASRRTGKTVDEVQAGFEATIPLGRYGDPGEFAAAAVFLLSGAASYITGATLQVDGGMIRTMM